MAETSTVEKIEREFWTWFRDELRGLTRAQIDEARRFYLEQRVEWEASYGGIARWGAIIMVRAANRGPSRDDYTEDEFDGLVWRWHYGFGGSIESPWCFCPVCDSVLVYSEEGGSMYEERRPAVHFTCEVCRVRRGTLDGDRAYIVARIRRLIDRKLRVGEWLAVVAQKQKRA